MIPLPKPTAAFAMQDGRAAQSFFDWLWGADRVLTGKDLLTLPEMTQAQLPDAEKSRNQIAVVTDTSAGRAICWNRDGTWVRLTHTSI